MGRGLALCTISSGKQPHQPHSIVEWVYKTCMYYSRTNLNSLGSWLFQDRSSNIIKPRENHVVVATPSCLMMNNMVLRQRFNELPKSWYRWRTVRGGNIGQTVHIRMQAVESTTKIKHSCNNCYCGFNKRHPNNTKNWA